MKFLFSIALIVLCFSCFARAQDWQQWEGSTEWRYFQSENFTPADDWNEDDQAAILPQKAFELPDNCFPKHTSTLGAWRQIRMLPVEVVSVRRGVLEFKYRDKADDFSETFLLTKTSILPANFAADYSGKWIVSYCEEHNKIYQIQRPAK